MFLFSKRTHLESCKFISCSIPCVGGSVCYDTFFFVSTSPEERNFSSSSTPCIPNILSLASRTNCGSGETRKCLVRKVAHLTLYYLLTVPCRCSVAQIRSRAEAAGCQHRHAYNYESLADARDFLDRIRPAATSHAEALAKVDPSLAPGQAAAGEKRTDTPAESNAVEELKARQHDKNDGNSSPAVE